MIDYANQFETKTCKLTMEKKLTKTDKNLIKNFITNCSSETTTGTKLSTHFNKRLPIETKRQQSSYSEKEGKNEGQCIKKIISTIYLNKIIHKMLFPSNYLVYEFHYCFFCSGNYPFNTWQKQSKQKNVKNEPEKLRNLYYLFQ